MITLFGCTHFFNFVSFLLYPMEVKRLRCAMLGAFTVSLLELLAHIKMLIFVYSIHEISPKNASTTPGLPYGLQ